MPKMFQFKNLAVSVLPGSAADVDNRLKLCLFHSTICLGWTQCHFHTICQIPSLVTCWKFVSCLHHSCAWGTCLDFSPPCPLHSIDCRFGTCPAGSGCPVGSGCPGGSIYETDPRQVDPVVYVQQLNELKEDLRTALAQIEEHEKTIGDVTKPATLAEAEQLENELKGALKEIDAMKGQLRRKKT